MKKLLIPVVCVLALAACNRTQVPTWTNNDPQVNPDGTAYTLKVTPVITKVTETKFESLDVIGVTVTREAGVWAYNEPLIFDGNIFFGELKWYAEGTNAASIVAYYPYDEAGVPESFEVEADQTEGASSSDFVAGAIPEAYPSADPIVIPFAHKLSLITLTVINNADADILDITLEGVKLKALLDEEFNATVDETAPLASVKVYKKNSTSYAAIVPPQTAELSAKVELAGENIIAQNLEEATLAPGKKYNINMIVNNDNIKIISSGDVEDWEEGGDLNPGEEPYIDFEENLAEGYFIYDNVKYNIVLMDDGKWWMAQNLAYYPEGFVPGAELNNVTAGVYYPLKVNSTNTALEFDVTGEAVAANGLLYQAECALGLKVGDIETVAQAEALEGAQGICPEGWHIPTIADITGLVGKAVAPIATNADAPYYDGSNGSIALLNADGFNMDAFGAISIQDNTKTAGSFMGWASGYPDKISSGMIIGSSYAGVTYNTTNDETSGIKNIQFYGLMPMTNKASEAQYTCNGTKVSYRIAGPVRCVRNAE